jgi:hypothetical protein
MKIYTEEQVKQIIDEKKLFLPLGKPTKIVSQAKFMQEIGLSCRFAEKKTSDSG